jgi:hypothetical protein
MAEASADPTQPPVHDPASSLTTTVRVLTRLGVGDAIDRLDGAVDHQHRPTRLPS